MSLEAAERIAHSLLYEGYLLYPYYPSATKNRQRWTFGGIYPASYVEKNPGSDASEMQTECLIIADASSRISIRSKFLHLLAMTARETVFDGWEEAQEREVSLSGLSLGEILDPGIQREFCFSGSNSPERKQEPVQGLIEIRAHPLDERIHRLQVRIRNTSPEFCEKRSDALLRSMISTHTILSIADGEFVSALDPPEPLHALVSQCRNFGTWPILVGAPGQKSVMLSSPVILYDYPALAPESPGELFDSAEIDEILTLRILTLTDEEKSWIRSGDAKGRALLERTEKLTQDELLQLHGRLRELKPKSVRVEDRELRPGDRVRLRPSGRGDIFDIALSGMIARIESIEQTLEGEIQLSVTLEEDPGRDFGMKGIPGHRFFFSAHEVEPI